MDSDLATWKWLVSTEGADAVELMPASTTAAQMATLRRRYSLEQVRVASQCALARTKARAKFGEDIAACLVADVPGIEMASSMLVSNYKAGRFRKLLGVHGRVADLCCGIGGDSFGLHRAGLVAVGVDISESRCLMYEHNTGFSAVCGDAIADCPEDIQAFHLDPARRSVDGKRTLDLQDFMPGPDAWEKLLDIHPTGAIKLNPGVNAYELAHGEVEIIAEPAGLTQAVLWCGDLAGKHERRATALDKHGNCCTISGEPYRPEQSSTIDQYLGTLNPCLERADLVGSYLEQSKARLVHPGTGMVTASVAHPHGMVRWHRVLDVMKWNRKRVKAALRAFDIGIVEVRTRGGVINPDDEQRQLRGKGENNGLTVFIYRIDQQIKAIIAERVVFDIQQKTPYTHTHAQGREGLL